MANPPAPPTPFLLQNGKAEKGCGASERARAQGSTSAGVQAERQRRGHVNVTRRVLSHGHTRTHSVLLLKVQPAALSQRCSEAQQLGRGAGGELPIYSEPWPSRCPTRRGPHIRHGSVPTPLEGLPGLREMTKNCALRGPGS